MIGQRPEQAGARVCDGADGEYTVKLDTGTEPARIDLTFDSPDSRPVPGIFKFDADKLIVLCGKAGGPRPDSFDGKAGTKFVLRRAKTP